MVADSWEFWHIIIFADEEYRSEDSLAKNFVSTKYGRFFNSALRNNMKVLVCSEALRIEVEISI